MYTHDCIHMELNELCSALVAGMILVYWLLDIANINRYNSPNQENALCMEKKLRMFDTTHGKDIARLAQILIVIVMSMNN